MPKLTESEVKAIDPGFNLQTHKWNSRGMLESVDHYRLHCIRGTQYFERPVNSGNVFYKSGDAAGRIVRSGTNFSVDHDAKHEAYTAPPTGAEKVAKELAHKSSEVERLEAELNAIRAERKFSEMEEKAQKTNQVAPQVKKPQPGKDNL